MKKLLLLLASVALLTGCGSAVTQSNDKEAKGETVYICTGGYSKRYHATRSCKGLRNCGGTIKAISIEDAEEMGRTPCRICYE
jgi:uncharacterized protein YceK